jgi:hypothetical protein
MTQGATQGYNVKPEYEQRKPAERKIPYSGSASNNPYYDDSRKIARNFVLVENKLYENEQMEQYVMNMEKMRLLFKFVFVGLILLAYGLI